MRLPAGKANAASSCPRRPPALPQPGRHLQFVDLGYCSRALCCLHPSCDVSAATRTHESCSYGNAQGSTHSEIFLPTTSVSTVFMTARKKGLLSTSTSTGITGAITPLLRERKELTSLGVPRAPIETSFGTVECDPRTVAAQIKASSPFSPSRQVVIPESCTELVRKQVVQWWPVVQRTPTTRKDLCFDQKLIRAGLLRS